LRWLGGRSICIQDLRAPCGGLHSDAPSIRIEEAHAGAVNCVEWNPFDKNLLLSTGFDNSIQVRIWWTSAARFGGAWTEAGPRWQVYDARKPGVAWRTFTGHSLKGKDIYSPQWADYGRAVVSGALLKRLSVPLDSTPSAHCVRATIQSFPICSFVTVSRCRCRL